MISQITGRFPSFATTAGAALLASFLFGSPATAQRYRVANPEGESLLEAPFSLDLGGATALTPDETAPQPSKEFGEAPPPSTALRRHVNDFAGLVLEAVEARLEEEFKLRGERDGVLLYFVTAQKAPPNVADYSASLCDATLPPSAQLVGGVLLLESSPSRITVSLTTKARLLIPDDAVAELIDKAVADQKEDVSPGALLAFTGRRLADRLHVLEQERSEAARFRNIALLGGGGLLGSILIVIFVRGFLAMWIRNLFDRRYYFPETQTPERLGGMFGGGHSATINFRRKI